MKGQKRKTFTSKHGRRKTIPQPVIKSGCRTLGAVHCAENGGQVTAGDYRCSSKSRAKKTLS